MEGKRLLTKKQVQAELGVGRKIVEEMFATPGFPVRKQGHSTAYVWEPDFWKWLGKEWRK